MTLWQNIKGWATKNANKYIYEPIPPERVEGSYDDRPLEVYGSYFRIYLSEIFLTKSRNWFKDWYPAGHTVITLKFADRAPVALNHVTHLPEQDLARGIQLNYAVTNLIPFNGGTVEIDVGLLALEGKNHLQSAIKVLHVFSGLVAGPMAQAVTVTEKIGTGIQEIFSSANGAVQLTLHDTFDDAGHPLRRGYFAAILATPQQIDRSKLRVRDHQLYMNGQPFRGHDYLLLRIDGVDERGDWRMEEIQKNVTAAKASLLRKRDPEDEEYKNFRAAALVAVYETPDLAEYDRLRVADAIHKELDAVAERVSRLGAVAEDGGEVDMNAMMATYAMTRPNAASRGLTTLEEALEMRH